LIRLLFPYRLTTKPENKPAVDFEYYRSKIPDQAFVDKLEKFVSVFETVDVLIMLLRMTSN
jgi:hypothetical protein